tara:strand:+ start:64 stop:282 length:219 start_codon:yes stop_codon:yes gene_type:complete
MDIWLNNYGSKEQLIHELTSFDCSCYRKNGLIEKGYYTYEPPKFRTNLTKIYNKLSKEDIKELLKIRKAEKL